MLRSAPFAGRPGTEALPLMLLMLMLMLLNG